MFPGAPDSFIDLSTGINPVPYPMPTLPEACFARLPEPDALAALQRAAASAYGLADPDLVVAAPGTQILIQVLPRLFARRRVAVLGPTYAEHLACWRAAGHAAEQVGSLEAAEGADIVVLCNPNNPDGRRIQPARLTACARELAARGGLVVVDEAFADFVPALSVAPALPCGGLVVLRSFGKAYGLAGVRLGFALTDPGLATRLRAALGPWAVSGPAIAIGTVALADAAWRERAARRLDRDATRLDLVLTDAGLAVVGGTSLYRLARHEQASVLFDRLGRAGLLVRRFAEHPTWLRFGIPGAEAVFARLQRALNTASPPPAGG